MKPALAYFRAPLLFGAGALMAAWLLGGIKGAVTIVFLGLLETSLSFDNAVVNASVLQNWDARWRRYFVVWGILVAVFGMRIVFPLAIVAVAGQVGPWQALTLAVDDPAQYGRILKSAHPEIAAYGGAFLMMVFLKFFAARHKTEHWFRLVERPLTRLGKLEAIEAALTLVLVLLAATQMDAESNRGFIAAGVWGVVSFVFVKGLAAILGGGGDPAHQVVRQGMAGFLYLEVLDASFSLDGVVGAFAITHDLFLIVLGLAAGAMFVRAFTLLLVDRAILGNFRYLEHGAFWAIGALAAIMLASVEHPLPEFVTGSISAALILMSLGSSIMANRRDRRVRS